MDKKKIFSCTFLFYFFLSCSGFQQNDFIESKILFSRNGEIICYEVYKTGIDNYDFIFFSKFKNNSTKIFCYNLNDAIYTALDINLVEQNNALIIEFNMPTNELYGKTKAETNYHFRQNNCLKTNL